MGYAMTVERSDEWKLTLAGCGILILGAYLKIPFYPISFTMHTCALWIIGLTLPPRLAVRTVLLYLGLATVGLPVFGGHGNPLWMLGKSAGYLLAFPIAVYVVSYLRERGMGLLGIVLGHCVIYLLGFLGLLAFVGPGVAFQKGVLLFIPSGILKTAMAYGAVNYLQEKTR